MIRRFNEWRLRRKAARRLRKQYGKSRYGMWLETVDDAMDVL